MRTVWKYPIDSHEDVSLPSGARVVHVAKQNHIWTMWALVDSGQPPEARRFAVTGTGHPVPDDATYVGTFRDDPFVWHVFELPIP